MPVRQSCIKKLNNNNRQEGVIKYLVSKNMLKRFHSSFNQLRTLMTQNRAKNSK